MNSLLEYLQAFGGRAKELAQEPQNYLAGLLQSLPDRNALQGAVKDPEFYKGLLSNTKEVAGGLLTGAVGAPVDIATMMMRPGGYKVPDKDVVGSSNHLAGLLGLNTESPQYQIGSLLPTDAADAMKYMGLLGPIAFHGSPRKFDKIVRHADATTLGGFTKHGVSVSPQEGVATRYAKDFSKTPGYVYKVDADVQKPLSLEAKDFEKLQSLVSKIDRNEPLSELDSVSIELILGKSGIKPTGHPIDDIKGAGYDYITKDAGRYGVAEPEWLVFDPEKIKILERKRAKK